MTCFAVDADYERAIDEQAAPGDDFRNLRYIARLTLYRLPLDACRALFRKKKERFTIEKCFIHTMYEAQDVSPGEKLCYFPMRDILAGDFFPYGDYDCAAEWGKELREEYERLAGLVIADGYAEQIDALAAGVPFEYVFQGDYTMPYYAPFIS